MQFRATRRRNASYIMTSGQTVGAQFTGQLQKIGKFHSHIALHARNRRSAGHIFVGEYVHDRILEPAGVIKNIMGNAKSIRDRTRVTNILPRTTAADSPYGFTMIVKLQGNADGFRAGSRSQGRHDARIDTPRHRHNNALACQIVAELEISVDSIRHINCSP